MRAGPRRVRRRGRSGWIAAVNERASRSHAWVPSARLLVSVRNGDIPPSDCPLCVGVVASDSRYGGGVYSVSTSVDIRLTIGEYCSRIASGGWHARGRWKRTHSCTPSGSSRRRAAPGGVVHRTQFPRVYAMGGESSQATWRWLRGVTNLGRARFVTRKVRDWAASKLEIGVVVGRRQVGRGLASLVPSSLEDAQRSHSYSDGQQRKANHGDPLRRRPVKCNGRPHRQKAQRYDDDHRDSRSRPAHEATLARRWRQHHRARAD